MNNIQLFVNTDDTGAIINAQYGENIIMTDTFTFCFLVTQEVIDSLSEYRVQITGYQTSLVRV